MKQKLFTLLAFLTSVGTMFAESGTCGPNLTWDLTNGVLTISGTGNMTDYSYNTAPWYSYRSSIIKLSIGNSVTSIGNSAFFGCTGLTSVTIPNSVTSIGESAFSGCSGLTSIEIPNSVTSIGSYAFDNCSGLKEVHITDLAKWCAISFGYYSAANPLCYAHNLYLNNEQITNLVIPNSVTSIGSRAFYGCTGLTSVTIPNSVTSIGYAAFTQCSKLTSITIPNSVTSIGNDAFDICSGLKEVHITDLAKWCAISFENSTANPLHYAHNLYLNNEQITNLVIPNSVTSIGNYAFRNCTGLTSIEIPNSVTSIGNSAFYGCIGLTSIEIPNSVTSIGNMAFAYCSNLKIINMKATTPPAISSYTFRNIHSDAVVYVPFGGMKNYSTASYWKKMKINCIATINQKITYSPTSCTIAFEVEDVDLQSCGIEGGETFAGNILEYIGLEPGSEYKDVPIVLTSNTGEIETVNVSFTTSGLQLATQESKPVSSNTAILLAETNMAEIETNCGFEWKRNDTPEDMPPSKVFCPVANGLMAGRLKGLKEEVYYKYRAFYQSAAGNMYYGDWKYIFTGDVAVEFDPILYTYAAIAVKENEATLKGYALAGSEDFTEQGFEYWAESRANNAPRRTAASIGEHKTVTASGISMKATLTDLDEGTVYRYRSYAKIGSQTFYGSEMTLTTLGEYHDSQAIEDIHVDASQATKILHNGQIYILRGDKVYILTGQEVR